MKKYIAFILIITILIICVPSCSEQDASGEAFYAGYAENALKYGDMDEYYIAGYKGGRHPTGILDPQYVKAVWLDNGISSVLMITVDCVALDGGTVEEIRKGLKRFVKKSGCDSVNVISTHTHAGVDTLGLWGPVGINGKNEEFNEQIISLAVSAAENAYAERTRGRLLYSAIETNEMQKDSRYPQVYDENIYQLRFLPDDGGAGIRLVSFAAHAEALRGDNLMISADFPGEMARLVNEACGDRLVFLPGAIGGLIMTPDLVDDAVTNMKLTAARLAEYVLSPENERELMPNIRMSRVDFDTELDNTLFIYYKFLGILGNDVKRGMLGTYKLTTELTLISIGGVTLSLLPGEIFPELVYENGGIADMATEQGISELVPIGLANDEIGYIIPKNDFVLNEDAPYVKEAEGHYEETNSVGANCAEDLMKAFKKALKNIK